MVHLINLSYTNGNWKLTYLDKLGLLAYANGTVSVLVSSYTEAGSLQSAAIVYALRNALARRSRLGDLILEGFPVFGVCKHYKDGGVTTSQ